jgi:hypothetical protein
MNEQITIVDIFEFPIDGLNYLLFDSINVYEMKWIDKVMLIIEKSKDVLDRISLKIINEPDFNENLIKFFRSDSEYDNYVPYTTIREEYESIKSSILENSKDDINYDDKKIEESNDLENYINYDDKKIEESNDLENYINYDDKKIEELLIKERNDLYYLIIKIKKMEKIKFLKLFFRKNFNELSILEKIFKWISSTSLENNLSILNNGINDNIDNIIYLNKISKGNYSEYPKSFTKNFGVSNMKYPIISNFLNNSKIISLYFENENVKIEGVGYNSLYSDIYINNLYNNHFKNNTLTGIIGEIDILFYSYQDYYAYTITTDLIVLEDIIFNFLFMTFKIIDKKCDYKIIIIKDYNL